MVLALKKGTLLKGIKLNGNIKKEKEEKKKGTLLKNSDEMK